MVSTRWIFFDIWVQSRVEMQLHSSLKAPPGLFFRRIHFCNFQIIWATLRDRKHLSAASTRLKHQTKYCMKLSFWARSRFWIALKVRKMNSTRKITPSGVFWQEWSPPMRCNPRLDLDVKKNPPETADSLSLKKNIAICRQINREFETDEKIIMTISEWQFYLIWENT